MNLSDSRTAGQPLARLSAAEAVFNVIRAEIESGKASFQSLEKYMLEKGEITPNKSGRQEMLEGLVNRFV